LTWFGFFSILKYGYMTGNVDMSIHPELVTLIPDVSRKSGTCVNISTGYIKIYNIKFGMNNNYIKSRSYKS
jgi:hypothetical protein